MIRLLVGVEQGEMRLYTDILMISLLVCNWMEPRDMCRYTNIRIISLLVGVEKGDMCLYTDTPMISYWLGWSREYGSIYRHTNNIQIVPMIYIISG